MNKAIEIARRACAELGAEAVVVHVWIGENRLGFGSWGKTRERCQQARALADLAHDMFMDVSETVAVLAEYGGIEEGEARRRAVEGSRRRVLEFLLEDIRRKLGGVS